MKNSFILLVVALVATALVYGIVQTQPTPTTSVPIPSSETDTATTTGNESASAAAPSGTGSLASLIALGERLVCEYQYTPDAEGTVAGTAYIDGATGRVRSDFAMQQAGAEYNSSLIIKDSRVYTWTDSATSDLALVMDMTAAGSTTTPTDTVSLDESVQYDCRAWSLDESVFVLPSDITFQTMQEMIHSRTQGLPADVEPPAGMSSGN